MNIYDATETAYKNGYAQGMKDAIAKNNNVGDKWTPTDDEMSANTEIFDVYIPCRTCGKLIPAGGHNHCLTCRVWQLRLEETMPKWISVKDRLPENREDVLVVAFWHERWNVQWGWYAPNGRVWHVGLMEETDYPVSHWMPLPEPPKGE